MKYTVIDMNNYPRRGHFEYYKDFAYPYTGLTAMVDVSRLKEFTKQNGFSFFLTCTYIAAKAANRIPEFRRRIKEEGIIEYPNCGTSHVEPLENQTFCYCKLYYDKLYTEFLEYAVKEQQKSKQEASIVDDEETDAMYFISAIPWVHYTNLVQAVPCNRESNPRISFGRYEETNGKLMMPVTVLVHHALMDGYHVGLFYQYYEEEMEALL